MSSLIGLAGGGGAKYITGTTYDTTNYVACPGEENDAIQNALGIPHTLEWEQLTSGAVATTGHRCAAVGGKIYKFGGYDGTNHLGTLWEYNISTDTWTQKTSCTTTSFKGGLFAIGTDTLIAIIGYDGAAASALAYKYTISTDTWTAITSMPGAKYSFAPGCDGTDKVYSFCGYDGAAEVSTCYEYSVSGDSWTTLSALATIQQAGGAFYNGIFLTLLGYDGAADTSNMYKSSIGDPAKYTNISAATYNLQAVYSEPTADNTPAANAPVVNGWAYVHGGATYGATFFRVNMTTSECQQLADTSFSFTNHDMCAYENTLYVIGTDTTIYKLEIPVGLVVKKG